MGICLCVTTRMLTTLSTHCSCAVVAQQRACRQLPELHLEYEGQYCGYLSLRHNWNVLHSDDELTSNLSYNSNSVITGTSTTTALPTHLSPSLPPAPTGNPLWGSRAPPLTDVIMTVVLLCTDSGVHGAWVALPRREATLDGLVLRATAPKGVSPIIGPTR